MPSTVKIEYCVNPARRQIWRWKRVTGLLCRMAGIAVNGKINPFMFARVNGAWVMFCDMPNPEEYVRSLVKSYVDRYYGKTEMETVSLPEGNSIYNIIH